MPNNQNHQPSQPPFPPKEQDQPPQPRSTSEKPEEPLMEPSPVSIPETPQQPPPQQQPFTPPAAQPEPLPEKREFLRREEVKTMQKDLMRLQEEEALKERERLSKIKTEEELKKERERIARLKKEEEEKIFARSELLEQERTKLQTERIEKQAAMEKPAPTPPPEKKEWPKPTYQLPFALPKRPSVFEKFSARLLVVMLLLAFWGVFITFWYWFLVVRKKEIPPEPTPPPIEVPTPTPTETPKPPEETPSIEVPTPSTFPPVSAALFPTETQAIIEFSFEDELSSLFREQVRRFGEENTFNRIVFYNKIQNNYLTLPEFLAIFKVNAPPSVLEHLSGDFTAFVYSSKIANRFGFITQVQAPDELNQIMLAWEPTMEQDTENLFALLDKRESAVDKKFRKATYKGATFRYISFPAINFGLVWAILSAKNQATGEIEYYLAFTSSGESMMRVIDRLEVR